MNVKCACGARYRRVDIVAKYYPKYGRWLYKDIDPLVAHWQCPGCGEERTQRKRQPKMRVVK